MNGKEETNRPLHWFWHGALQRGNYVTQFVTLPVNRVISVFKQVEMWASEVALCYFVFLQQEISFVRFYKVLLKSNDLLREGIFNCILYYMYVKEEKTQILMAGSQRLRKLHLVTGFLQSPNLPRSLLFLPYFGIPL